MIANRPLVLPAALLLWIASATLAGPPSDDQLLYKPEASRGAASATLPVVLQSVGPQAPVAPGSQTEVEIYFQVAENSYVNHEMTKVTLGGADGLAVQEPVFPEPLVKDVPSLGKIAKIHKGNFVVRVPISVASEAAAGQRSLALSVRYQACDDQVCFIPKTEKFDVMLTVAAAAPGAQPRLPQTDGADASAAQPPAEGPAAAVPSAEPAPQTEFARQLERGLLFAYLFAFFGGILASLTPCVYPMIPITVAVIGARGAQSRKTSFTLSLVFVLGIALVYSLLGVTAAATGSVFGSLLQNRYLVGLIALVFAALALGMLGFYDMNVPAPLANRLNRMGGKGYGGSLVVGMVTGIVASPCVGPVLVGMLGWIAAAAANPAYSRLASLGLGFSLMFVFALGLGMLFVLIGTFTGVLVSLPRSGAWMIRIKHVLGALLFGVAWYFALPILPIWVPVALLGPVLLYLASGELEHARDRKLAGAWMAAASTYVLLLGAATLWPGTVITGWTPTSKISTLSASDVAWLDSEPAGLEAAALQQKPVMIDFYADWCIACKELDLYTYADPRVAKALEGFVSVKIDGTDDSDPAIQALYRKYGVLGLPTVVFMTPQGRVLPGLTLTGFENPEPFLQRLDAARKGA